MQAKRKKAATTVLLPNAGVPSVSPSAKRGKGKEASETMLPPVSMPAPYPALRELYRQRTDLHGAEKRLTLQIKAIGRREAGGGQQHDAAHAPIAPDASSDAVTLLGGTAMLAAGPLIEAQTLIRLSRLKLEKQLVAVARTLPGAELVERTHGFGYLGLAIIVGEANGPLTLYANPAKLWKRLGLAVINGKAQGKIRGAGAIEQGYSPRRRSAIWTIGDSLLKKPNAYRELYLSRKAYEHARNKTLPPATGPENAYGTRTPLPGEQLSDMQLHRRAQRYVEKRLVLDLWKIWRKGNGA